MSRGKKPHLDRPVEVSINIPETLLARVSLLLFDPVRGSRKHGALSALVTGLLKEWISRQGAPGGDENTEETSTNSVKNLIESGDIQASKE